VGTPRPERKTSGWAPRVKFRGEGGFVGNAAGRVQFGSHWGLEMREGENSLRTGNTCYLRALHRVETLLEGPS